jgi:hypothetical protein
MKLRDLNVENEQQKTKMDKSRSIGNSEETPKEYSTSGRRNLRRNAPR